MHHHGVAVIEVVFEPRFLRRIEDTFGRRDMPH